MGKNKEKEEQISKDLRFVSGERIEPQIFDVIVKRNGKFVVKHTEYNMVFDSVLKEWKSEKHKAKVTYLPLSSWKPEISQDLTVKVYFRRYGFDPLLRPVSIILEKKMRIKATFEDEYFCLMDGIVIRTFLDSGVSDPISYRDPRWEVVGSERKLSDKEVKELEKNKVPIFDETPEGLVRNLT